MLPDGTLPDDYVVLDLETTGVSWYRDTIIEFGAVKVVDRKPVDTYQQLVNPMRNLNPFITQLTGITPDMLEPAPTLATVLPDFLRWCGDDAMIGHNIMQFDIKFIDLAAQRILHHAVPNRIIDTLQMSRSMYPQYNRHRLVDLIQRFDIADVEEHRALSDAEQTQMCFEYMRDEQRRRERSELSEGIGRSRAVSDAARQRPMPSAQFSASVSADSGGCRRAPPRRCTPDADDRASCSGRRASRGTGRSIRGCDQARTAW